MPLELKKVQQSDIPRLVTIYFTSFQNPHSQACWPRTPSVRRSWEQMIRSELQDPDATFLKIVNSSPPLPTTHTEASVNENKEESIAGGTDPEDQTTIAWAKWVQHQEGHELDVSLPNWPEEADGSLCTETFGAWARERVEIMARRGHWYLELLATHPVHQGRGAGGMLMDWGVRRADADGVEAYLEASPEGVGLYKRFGFEEASVLDTKIRSERVNDGEEVVHRNIFMLRKARTTV